MPNFDPRNQLLSDISSGIESIVSISSDITDSDKFILENIKLNIPKLDTNTLFMIREYITANLKDCMSNYVPLVSDEEQEDVIDTQEDIPANEEPDMLDKLTDISDYAEEVVDLAQNAIDNVSDMDIVAQLINIKLFINDKLENFQELINQGTESIDMAEVITDLEDFQTKLEGYSKLIENITTEELNGSKEDMNELNSNDQLKDPNKDEEENKEETEENKELVSSKILVEETIDDEENLIQDDSGEAPIEDKDTLTDENLEDTEEVEIPLEDQFEEIKKSLEEISQNISTNNPEMSTSIEDVQEKIETIQNQIKEHEEEELLEEEDNTSEDELNDDFEPIEDDDEDLSLNKTPQTVEEQLNRIGSILNKNSINSDEIIMPGQKESSMDKIIDEIPPVLDVNAETINELRNLSFKYGDTKYTGKPEEGLSEALLKLSDSLQDDDRASINDNVDMIKTMVAVMDETVQNEVLNLVDKIHGVKEIAVDEEPLEEGFEDGNTH